MTKPLLSVLVPIYNVESYLPKCLDSIINQTYTNIEIICVDDGSTDNSLEILKEYQLRDPRIIIIHKENGGLVSARKAAMELAQGEYIGYVDSDDWIEPNMYDMLMSLALKDNVDIVCGAYYKDYTNYSVSEHQKYKSGIYKIADIIDDEGGGLCSYKDIYDYKITVFLVDKIYKKSIIYDNQMSVPSEIGYGEDVACLWPTILNGKNIGIIDECLYHYCVRKNSMSFNVNAYEMESVFHYLSYRIKEKCCVYKTLMKQFEILKLNYLLLIKPQCVVRYKNGCLVPFGKLDSNARIVIYGAGQFGMRLKEIMANIAEVTIVGVMDKNSKDDIIPIEDIDTLKFDYILICVLKHDLVEEIYSNLEKRGINTDKILYPKIENIFY